MDKCLHKNVLSINEYELIRKYHCQNCNEVMMCTCNKEIALKFLPHQIYTATYLDTKERVNVTAGFIENTCNACRGSPPVPAPMASMPKQTSKIKRYYWRELAFKEMQLFEYYGGDPKNYLNFDSDIETKNIIDQAKRQALKEVKILHEKEERYTYNEVSSAKIIEDYSIDIINLYAEYVKSDDRKAKIKYQDKLMTVEGYVQAILIEQGYKVTFLESTPIHVLFSVFMWMLIQDSTDSKVNLVGFGDRSAFENKQEFQTIWTYLPSDFGSSNYSNSRKIRIKKHFEKDMNNGEDLLWIFDYWVPYSTDLRQYLWAHHEESIYKARTLVKILPSRKIISILNYLVESYWERYLGWPDLLAYKEEEYIFIEVKSSKDRLSEEQKTWIKGNHKYLNLPFKIIKVHQKNH